MATSCQPVWHEHRAEIHRVGPECASWPSSLPEYADWIQLARSLSQPCESHLLGQVGLRPGADGLLSVNPLVPPGALPWWTAGLLLSILKYKV
jgi:hypothetical protein